MNNKISVIVVLFKNSLDINKYLSLVFNNINVILVDNTPKRDLNIKDKLFYIPLLENKGIAYAQNIGINKAISLGTEFVIFFDQDSVINKDYIFNIIREYKRIEKDFHNLYLLGPTVLYEKTNEEYKSIFHKYKEEVKGFEIRREIISSGSCTRVEKIQNVGLLDDRLFIDHVDSEWCWRSNNLGYISGITKNVVLKHNIGQRIIKIGKHMIIVSSPQRYYYQCRNYLWLCRRNSTPIQWRINNGIKIFMRLLYFPIFIDEGIQIVKNMYKGLHDGLIKNK